MPIASFNVGKFSSSLVTLTSVKVYNILIGIIARNSPMFCVPRFWNDARRPVLDAITNNSLLCRASVRSILQSSYKSIPST